MFNTFWRSIYDLWWFRLQRIFSWVQIAKWKRCRKSDSEDNPERDEISDPTFQCRDSDEAEKTEQINSVLREFGEPSIKKPRVSKLSHKEQQTLSQTFSTITSDNNGFDDNDLKTLYNRDIRAALSQQNDRDGKIQILTTLPWQWTIAKIRRESNVSRRTASKAKIIRNKSGYGSRPNKKKILAAKSGTHNERVCKIHLNMK